MLEAVLFDWGDTLMRFEWNDDVAREGTSAGLAALGREDLPQAEQISRWFRAQREAGLFGAEDEIDLLAVLRGCFSEHGCRLSDDDVRLYMQASHAYWGRGYSVPPATHALLDALRERGLGLAIVSNTVQPSWLLAPVFEQQGLTGRVDAIVLSSDIGKRKPSPVIFEAALDALGVRADRALFVGDRRFEDVRGAASVGMTTVQALWFRTDEHADGWEPAFRAHTQLDVLDVVKEANGQP